MDDRVGLVVVDAANVVGSVPDGWWRDRAGATVRLRDALADVATNGLAADRGGSEAPGWVRQAPLDIVLVVEGAAREVPGSAEVRVCAAPNSGDDAIVELVRTEGAGRPCLVITADRQLRDRVRALGAAVLGPRAIHPTLR